MYNRCAKTVVLFVDCGHNNYSLFVVFVVISLREVPQTPDFGSTDVMPLSSDVLDVQLSDEEMSEFPTSETPGPPEVAKVSDSPAPL